MKRWFQNNIHASYPLNLKLHHIIFSKQVYAYKTILQRAESTRIKWTLLPPPDRAPETEPPQPPLKLK